jgi:hypothetical protein
MFLAKASLGDAHKFGIVINDDAGNLFSMTPPLRGGLAARAANRA